MSLIISHLFISHFHSSYWLHHHFFSFLIFISHIHPPLFLISTPEEILHLDSRTARTPDGTIIGSPLGKIIESPSPWGLGSETHLTPRDRYNQIKAVSEIENEEEEEEEEGGGGRGERGVEKDDVKREYTAWRAEGRVDRSGVDCSPQISSGGPRTDIIPQPTLNLTHPEHTGLHLSKAPLSSSPSPSPSPVPSPVFSPSLSLSLSPLPPSSSPVIIRVAGNRRRSAGEKHSIAPHAPHRTVRFCSTPRTLQCSVALSCHILPSTILLYSALLRVTSPIPHYTTLHYTTLHYTTLHYTTLHYITLYCTILPAPHHYRKPGF